MTPADTAEALRARLPSVPATAIVIGSGLAALEDALDEPVAVPFGDLTGLPGAGVAGHAGRFVHGRLGGVEVLVQAGRIHAYEGHPMETVVLPVRVLAALGVGTLVLTNAAGGIHPHAQPGDLVLLDDVINLQFRSPLAGPVADGETRFPDMSRPFDPALCTRLQEVARTLQIPLGRGAYAAVLGPAYETRAEIRMLERLGADLVGMSTVPEVVTAAALGVRCAAISLVTNRATGLGSGTLSHEEVLEVGRRAAERVVALLRGVIAEGATR